MIHLITLSSEKYNFNKIIDKINRIISKKEEYWYAIIHKNYAELKFYKSYSILYESFSKKHIDVEKMKAMSFYERKCFLICLGQSDQILQFEKFRYIVSSSNIAGKIIKDIYDYILTSPDFPDQ